MSREDKTKELRRVAVSSHQVFWLGYFHCFANIKGETVALVENEAGTVNKVYLDNYYLEFRD